MKRHEPEQLNMPDVSESFDLEDIIREFSSGKIPEPKPDPVKDQTLVFKPIRTVPKAKPPAEDEPVKLAPEIGHKKSSHDAKPSPGFKIKIASDSAPSSRKSGFIPPVIQYEKAAPKKEEAEASPKRRKRAEERPLHSFSCRELLALEQKGFAARRVRTALLLLPALFSLFLLFRPLLFPAQTVFSELHSRIFSLSTLLISMILSYEVFRQGVQDILRIRISLYTLAIPLCILCIIDCLLSGDTLPNCYSPCVCLILFFLQRSVNLTHNGFARSLHTVCGFSKPMGLYDAGQLLPDSDSLRKDAADTEDYLARLTQPDGPQTILCVYATFLLPVCCGAAFLIHYFASVPFVRAWLLLLLYAMPLYASLSFAAAFSSLARKLSKQGGALCGWHSARTFGKRHTIILRDEDLFPTGCFSSNGMKLYGTYRAERVIAYAHAAFSAAENPLVRLFEELLRSEGATALTASTYRFYENNGMGAEILGDEVLIGTVSFMHSMGVHMPDGARVRQAVYVAIGGELAGIFAVKYKPSPVAKAGLRELLSNRNFTPVLATRDFLISPELLAQKYELSADGITCPEYPQRIRLSETGTGAGRTQGALIAEDSFSALAATVSAAHRLKLSAFSALLLSLLAGISGVILAITFLLSGSYEPLSGLYVGSYQLLWAGATALVCLVLRKF